MLCWTAIAVLAARWVRTHDDRLLLALGPVVGVGLLAKNLPLLFLVALAGAILICGPRELLRRPALWIAAVVAGAIWAPNLWWQATHGWPQLTMTGGIGRDTDQGGPLATVAGAHRALPPAERATAVIITANYGQAGAIDKYGPGWGLPAPYSGHLNFWRWGPPPDTATGPAIFVGDWTAAALTAYCGSGAVVAHVDNGYRVDNDEQGTPVWLCRDLREPWSQLWPRLRRFG